MTVLMLCVTEPKIWDISFVIFLINKPRGWKRGENIIYNTKMKAI
jgi:hypothetical protein